MEINRKAIESYGSNLFKGIFGIHNYAQDVEEYVRPPEPVFSQAELSTLLNFARATGIKPEGSREFTLKGYGYLEELYNDRREDPRPREVIMKAAQTGLTIYELFSALWWGSDTTRAVNIAMLFPSKDAVSELSAARFRPMLNSSSKLIQLAQEGEVNRVHLVRLAVSNIYFRGLRSGIAMDSVPLDVLLFDEVRLMSIRSIERTLIRITESTLKHKDGSRGVVKLNSTAGFPGMDIAKWFDRSSQGYWATHCPDAGCTLHKAGIILPLEFVSNHRNIIGERKGRYYLKCPKCGARISEPQNGHYEHRFPDAEWRGYQFSQLLKGEDFLNKEIMPAFMRGDNVPEFINSRIGLPYENTDAIPATESVVLSNRDPAGLYYWPELPYGFTEEWRAAGVDQRAGEKHVVIKTLMSDGRHRLDYIEIIEASGKDAADRIIMLMKVWGVKLLIMDGEPAYDLFIMVARGLEPTPCMVYMQDYVDGVANIVRFEDKHSDKTIKRASGELKWEQRALMDRYKAIDWSLNLFVMIRNLLPVDLYEKKQTRTFGGKSQVNEIGREWVEHMRNIARVHLPVYQTNPLTGEKFEVVGEKRMAWQNLAFDPHFVHANMYADIGLKYGREKMKIFIAGDSEEEKPYGGPDVIPHEANPATLQRLHNPFRGKVCGTCVFFDPDKELCTNKKLTLGRVVKTRGTSPVCNRPGGGTYYKKLEN